MSWFSNRKKRPEVMVDKMPDATMPKHELIAIGFYNGVKFGDCKTPDEVQKTMDVPAILACLYEQVEFTEWQSPVDEIRNRRSTVNPYDPDKDGTVYKFTVKYVGNMLMPVVVDGKSQIFVPHVPYTFGTEYAHVVDKIKRLPDFVVEFGPTQEDPFLSLVRKIRENRENDYGDDDKYDGFYV